MLQQSSARHKGVLATSLNIHTTCLNTNISEYYVHDVWDRPFKVTINKNTISIYKSTGLEMHDYASLALNENITERKIKYDYESLPILTLIPLGIFIGEYDPTDDHKQNYREQYDANYFKGNSILLDMGSNEYIFIGQQIYSFESFGKIMYFNSPVEHTDMPLPYAIDEFNNIYLMLDYMVIMNNKDVDINKVLQNPYCYYNYDILEYVSNKIYEKDKMCKSMNISLLVERLA
jgi:hypothetical protein